MLVPAPALAPTPPRHAGPSGSAGQVRHLISLDDLDDAELRWIVDRGCAYAAAGRRPQPVLGGAVVGIYFKKTSTRTRTAFSVGALRLGARVVTYGPQDLQTNTGETVEDTGRVMARMLDALVARTVGPVGELHALAGDGGMAVVNAMSRDEHPTQALADLVTLQRHFGRISGLRVLYLGEGNSTAAALALALSRYPGTELYLRTPASYGVPRHVRARAEVAATRNGSVFDERHDPRDLPEDVDVVYTTRWQTTGTAKDDPDWRVAFEPFRVGAELWKHNPRAAFMHDLPAHRGEEVAADVLDGPASIAFLQAEGKLHSAMAVLHFCVGSSAGSGSGPASAAEDARPTTHT